MFRLPGDANDALVWAMTALAMFSSVFAAGAEEDRFADLGPMSRSSQNAWRSGMAAVDPGNGHRLFFSILWAEGGNDASALVVDLEDGQSVQVPMPMDPEDRFGRRGQGSLGVHLSKDGYVYNVRGGYDVQDGSSLFRFDLRNRRWEYLGRTPGCTANSMSETDDGLIVIGMYPKGEIVTYDPKSGKITDLGPMVEDAAAQYPFVSTDDQGWVYALNQFFCHVTACRPATGEKKVLPFARNGEPVFKAEVRRGGDGKVYGRFDDAPEWLCLYDGHLRMVAKPDPSLALGDRRWGEWNTFPDGSMIERASVPDRTLMFSPGPGREARRIGYDYQSSGPNIYSLTAHSDGKIYGSTGVPLRMFQFDPATKKARDWGFVDYSGHFNGMGSAGGLVYAGLYSAGGLFAFDLREPVDPVDYKLAKNPRLLNPEPSAPHLFGRPFFVTAAEESPWVLMGGVPARASSAGGLLVYNRETRMHRAFDAQKLGIKLPTGAAVMTAAGVVIGTRATEGTGSKDGVAGKIELLVFDLEKEAVTRRLALPEGWDGIHQMVSLGDARALGIGVFRGAPELFVFDAAAGKLIHHDSLAAYGKLPVLPQVSQILAKGKNGLYYAFFDRSLAVIDPRTYGHKLLAALPVTGQAGFCHQNGWLYFGSKTHLWRYRLDETP